MDTKKAKCVICGKRFVFGSDKDDLEGDDGDICGQCVRDADAEEDTFDPEAA